MKISIFKIFLLVILIFTFYSCEKNNYPITSNHNDIKYTPPFDLDPSNSNNPYDSAGYYHNEGLDYIANNINGTSFDSTTFKETFANLIATYACNTGFEVPKTNCYTTIYDYVMDYFLNNIYMNVDDLIDYYGVSQKSKTKLNEICNICSYYSTFDSTSNTIQSLIDSINNWESYIINSLDYNEQEKKQILTFSAITRYSAAYWQNVYENENHPWRGCIECNNGLITRKSDKVQIFEEFQNLPWEYKVLGCALTDAGGGIDGGWVGALTATGVAATIYWWDDICAGAEWLWGKIEDGFEWVCDLF